MQRDFCASGGYADAAGLDISRLRAIIPALKVLVDAARSAGVFVIYTREGHLPDLSDCHPTKLERSRQAGAAIGGIGPLGRLLIRGEFGQDVVAELMPSPGDVVIDKPGYSAFPGTPLQDMLAEKGITQLILTGVTTEVCVHSTLRDAIDRGYRCITVADACASPYPHLQQAALDMISVEGGIFGEVVTAATVLSALAR